MMIPGDSIHDYMHISLKGKRALYKSELMMLEMLSEANWERPIYIAVSVGRENQLNMENHFVQEGLAYRFTPFDTSKTGVTIDSEKMYGTVLPVVRHVVGGNHLFGIVQGGFCLVFLALTHQLLHELGEDATVRVTHAHGVLVDIDARLVDATELELVQEGLAYRFTPFDTSKTGVTID